MSTYVAERAWAEMNFDNEDRITKLPYAANKQAISAAQNNANTNLCAHIPLKWLRALQYKPLSFLSYSMCCFVYITLHSPLGMKNM